MCCVFKKCSLLSVCSFQCADVDDDDWDISSLEEERSLGKKTGREQKEPLPVKNESNSTQVPSAWGASNHLKGPKGEGSLLECFEAQSIFQLLVSSLRISNEAMLIYHQTETLLV